MEVCAAGTSIPDTAMPQSTICVLLAVVAYLIQTCLYEQVQISAVEHFPAKEVSNVLQTTEHLLARSVKSEHACQLHMATHKIMLKIMAARHQADEALGDMGLEDDGSEGESESGHSRAHVLHLPAQIVPG